MSIPQVLNKNIPIVLKKDEDRLEIMINDGELDEWYKNTGTFIEKIKIKSILLNNHETLNSKKRL